MNPLKQPAMTLPWLMVVCIGGCAQSLPPHEGLNRAVTKSLAASGYNYSSQSRLTNLTVPQQDAYADPADKRMKYLGTGLDIVRRLSLKSDGAIDMQSKRSETLYDLRYDKDNVEISVKIPLLIDYDTQTIYVGTSFFNTILETLYPQAPAANGRLIRIDIGELLQQGPAGTGELSKRAAEYLFNPSNIDVVTGAIKVGILRSLAKLDDTCFSDQPLTGQDRKAGVDRRIRVRLGHKESVAAVLDLVEGIAQDLFRARMISQGEYDALLILGDRRILDGVVDKFTLAVEFDVAIDRSGFVSHVESQLNVADRDGLYRLGLSNISSFSSYNAPRFSIRPEASGTIDFRDILDVIMADTATDQDDPPSDADAADDSEITQEAPP